MNNQSKTAPSHDFSWLSAACRDTDPWIREAQLRAYLQVSASTIRRLRARGLPSLGKDRLRRYHLDTVLQWLSEHA